MGRYCEVSQVVARFRKTTDVVSYPGAVDSQYIYFAENELDVKLGPYFTVPFSSNNITATDLSIDMTYAKIIRYDDPERYKLIMEHIDSVIGDLIIGKAGMITTSGDQLLSGASNNAWSNTMDYHSAFGMDDFEYMQVSSQQLADEESAR